MLALKRKLVSIRLRMLVFAYFTDKVSITLDCLARLLDCTIVPCIDVVHIRQKLECQRLPLALWCVATALKRV